MTAYLQPGDQIHLSVPVLGHGQLEAIRGYYRERGVEIFMSTEVSGAPQAIEVVSVIRPATPLMIPDLVDPPGR